MQIALVISIPDDALMTIGDIDQLAGELAAEGLQIEKRYGNVTRIAEDIRSSVVMPSRPVLVHFPTT